MSNPNPYQARLAKALKRKPGNIDATIRRTWGVLCLAYDEVASADDGDQRRKAMLAYAQLVGVYAKLYELYQLEADVNALEHVASSNGHHAA